MNRVPINSRDDFKAQVLDNPGTIPVLFTADWCPYCKRVFPVLEEILTALPQLKLGILDIDKAQGVDDDYGVMTIPTLMVFKDGKNAASRMIAYLQPHEIADWIKDNCL